MDGRQDKVARLDQSKNYQLQNREQMFSQAIQSLSLDLFFHIDLQADTIYYFGSAQKALNLPEQVSPYSSYLKEAECLHDDDYEDMRKQMDAMYRGEEEACIYRLYDREGKINWYKKEYRLFFNEAGQPVEAIGRCYSLQAQKEMENQINFDSLTGCYRKKIFESMATHYLEQAPHDGHTLLLVDLDNFKAVNDNLGHQFGDVVLREVGDKLKSIFRSSDYVGRIGGDEFMVFIKDTSDTGIIEGCGQKILEVLDTTYHGANHAYRVTASVGIARYPQDGDTFPTLYHSADLALYDAKNRGKGDYIFYNPLLAKGTMENTLPFEVATRAMSQHFDYKLVANTFERLFANKDLEHAVDEVLASVGQRFGVSRAYVFESTSSAAKIYANTYEWCAEGIAPEQSNLQEIALDDFMPLFQHANQDGIIYCNDFSILESQVARDILESQGIKSFLHSYIRQEDSFTYAVGFDDCLASRVWSPIEITTLMHISKIIAQFLHYKKMLQVMDEISQERLSVLNSLNCCAYIIDVESHKLTYFNNFTQSLVPQIQVGDLCHKELRGYDEECFNCPLKTMRQEGTSSTRALIHAETLDVDMLVTANRLPSFQGRESVFVAAIRVDDVPGLSFSI